MGRKGLFGVLALGLLAACSSGGSSATPTTTTSTTTSTTGSTTTTTSPEDAVKTAYLAYWSMADRLFEAPTTSDPEIEQRTSDPLLTSLRDQLSTKAAQHHTISVPVGRTSSHTVSGISVSGMAATLTDCFVDGRVEFGSSGEVVDDEVVTKEATVSLTLIGSDWRVSDIRFGDRLPGVQTCAA